MARLVATANADAQGEGCTLSDKRVSTRRTKRKENKFRRTRREPEPILLRQDTKEGSERREWRQKGGGRQGRKEQAPFRSIPFRPNSPKSDNPFERVPFHSELCTACAEPGITHFFSSILYPGREGGYEGRSKLHSVQGRSPALTPFQGRTDGYEGRDIPHSVHDHSFLIDTSKRHVIFHVRPRP